MYMEYICFTGFHQTYKIAIVETKILEKFQTSLFQNPITRQKIFLQNVKFTTKRFMMMLRGGWGGKIEGWRWNEYVS